MSKTVFFLRHAKSSWDDPSLPDDQRPLNGRGRKAAKRMGQFFQHHDWKIDFVVCSTAVRTIETADRFFAEVKNKPLIAYRDEIYLASVDDLVETLGQVPDEYQQVMLIGHNPGFEEFVAQVTGKSLHFPTAALARIELEIEHWTECDSGLRGRLARIDRPKELSDH